MGCGAVAHMEPSKQRGNIDFEPQRVPFRKRCPGFVLFLRKSGVGLVGLQNQTPHGQLTDQHSEFSSRRHQKSPFSLSSTQRQTHASAEICYRAESAHGARVFIMPSDTHARCCTTAFYGIPETSTPAFCLSIKPALKFQGIHWMLWYSSSWIDFGRLRTMDSLHATKYLREKPLWSYIE